MALCIIICTTKLLVFATDIHSSTSNGKNLKKNEFCDRMKQVLLFKVASYQRDVLGYKI